MKQTPRYPADPAIRHEKKRTIQDRGIILVLLFGLYLVLAPAALPAAENDMSATRPEKTSPAESAAFQEWAFFPVIASETQTGLQLGALAIRFIEPSGPEERTSTVDFIAFGTTEGQYYARVGPDLYFSNGDYHLNLEFSGGYWPMNFYGIGGDTAEKNEEEYESTEYRFKFALERKFLKRVYAGIVGFYEYSDIDEISSPQQLIPGAVIGVQGRTKSGLGLALAFDSRDNVNAPRSGTYLRFEPLFFEEALGSDQNFQVFEVDMNHYRGVTENTAIALRGYLRAARGDIPFQDLSSPDGSCLLRGIENGRYRDRDLVGLQTEFRYPIYPKWGGTVFAETAQVAREFADLTGSNWKYSVGAGLRYALNPSERFNIRLDVSWVDEGFGLVLNIREAF